MLATVNMLQVVIIITVVVTIIVVFSIRVELITSAQILPY